MNKYEIVDWLENSIYFENKICNFKYKYFYKNLLC